MYSSSSTRLVQPTTLTQSHRLLSNNDEQGRKLETVYTIQRETSRKETHNGLKRPYPAFPQL